MRLIRFDPLFAVLTLLVTIYVVFDARRGGDPTTVMLAYLLLTATAVVIDLLAKFYRRRWPKRQGVRVR